MNDIKEWKAVDIEETHKTYVICPYCNYKQSFFYESGSTPCPNCKKDFYVKKCPSCMSENSVPEISKPIKCWSCGIVFNHCNHDSEYVVGRTAEPYEQDGVRKEPFLTTKSILSRF